MFGQKKCTAPQQNDRPKPAPKAPGTSRVKASLLSLESRLMFDAAATATAAEVNQEQVAQEQAESAVSAEGGGEPTAAEQESQELLQAITTYNPGESKTEIVFVDPTVPNYQELLSGIDPNIAVIMLDGGQDGVEQMASALAGCTGIDAIHLISHGGAGELQLGTGTLTTESMSGQYADELAIIQQALSGQADILVYGCDFAEGQAGQEAATLLSQLTGADVAASTDATGFAALGGDWVLETQIGTIETQIAVDDGIQANWVGLLAAPVVDLNAGGVGNNVTTAFTEQTSVLIAPVGTLSDVDSANLNQFSVTLTARPNGNAVESLSLNAAATTVASGAGLTVSYTASTGVLLITGTASTATYQTILQGILYNNTSDQPTTSNRSITVVARDSTNASSTSRTATITVTAVNDASTITSLSGDSRAYSEGAGAVVIESGNAVVADVDSTNFDTGTLTVRFTAGSDAAEDVLSIRHQGTGAGQIGVSGSTITYGGTTIGTFTGGSSGSNLVITLNSSATPTAVTALVRNITYQNTDTNAPTTGARTVRFVLTDGDGGTSPNYDTTVTVSSVNDAPVLADTALALTVAEDAGVPSGAVGSLVSTFTGGITDVDSGASKGLAITGSNQTNGIWYYTRNEGTTWTAVGTVSNTSALLLADNASTRLYFAPNANYNGTSSAALTVRAWDQTSGTAGTKVSTATNGGITAFSSATDTVDVTVTAVNDASTITSLSGDSRAYSEGAGAVVIESGNAVVADVDSTNFDTGTLTVRFTAGSDAAEDVLSIRHQGTGAGQIGVSGSTITYGGTTIGTFTGGSSGSNLVITLNSSATPTAVTALVRNITYQNTDTNAPTTGARTVRFVLTDGDGGTSPNYDTTVTVSSVNDAPVLADTALALTVAEDAGVPSGAVGSLVSTFTGGITDVDSGASKGLAITGSNQTNGIWYYTRNEGTTWTAVGTVSNTSALLLADNASTRLYFAPNANYNGTSSAALTVRAWDQTSGTAGTKVSTATNGGITAFSSATDTVDVTVTAVNDASTITSLSGDSRAYSEGAGAVVIESGNAVVADVDSTNFDTGTLTVRFTAGSDAAEDVLSIRHQGTGAGQIGVSGSTITYGGTTIGTFTGGSSGSNLVITLNSSATPTAVTALVRNITYQNTDTNAPTTGARTVRFVLTDGDGGTSPNYDTTVTVSAVNDAPTDLSLSANTVVENASNGTVVGIVTGTDPDTGDTQSYSLTNTAGGRFAINSATGEITVADGTLLDYESATSHSVTVRVTDAGGLTYDETFTINLTNVNETPTDLALSANTVVENASNGTVVGIVTGTDPDTGDTQSYSLTNTAGGRFAINSATGEITVADGTLLDYESATSHSVTVRVTDAGGLTYDETFTINLTNVNETPTDLALSANTVVENASNGTVVGIVTGTDPDTGDTQSYSLTNTAGGRFAINSATGEITVADGTLLDYESATSHSVTVRVTDAGGLTYDETFTINLTNVNETPTDLALSANTVVENASNGTVVGIVTGTDPDTGDTQSYSLTNTAGGRFAINSATGEITVADGTLLDYESATSHSVTVRVTDAGGLTYDETFTINLTNVNETPTDLALSANTVVENASNGTVVGIVTGTDPDTGDTQSYSLTNTAGGRFAINSATGEITVADGTLLDYESATSHSVTVRVTDAGGLTYDETFTINLTNVNETPTDLALSANTVVENASNGTVVGIVTGTDPDTGDTQSYSLTNTAGGRFAINSATGEITVADGTLLDYESATSHSVTVRVTDAGGLTYDETFTINLTNVNETPSSTGQESNTVIAVLGAAKPVAPAVERANTISEVEVRPLDDLGMSIEARPEPSFRVDAIITPAKDLPHLAHTAVVEQAAILGGKQNLPISSDKREEIAVSLDATENQDVARLGSHNPTVQHAEEMETRSDESSGLDMPMAAGLAGMMLLHGNTGMKDRMTTMSRRIRGLPQGPPSDTKPGESNEDQEGSVPQESGNHSKVSNKSDQS